MAELNSEFQQVIGELPAHVQPMVDYAQRLDPEVVIVCDRDARPIGQVFERLAEAEDYNVPLLYKHVSKRIGPSASELIATGCQDVRDIVSSADEPAKIMVIDDYVSKKAGTMILFRTAMRRLALDVDIHWVTLAGRGTALNILPYASPANTTPWRDRPDIIGVDYNGLEQIPVDTELSREFTHLIDSSVKRYLAEHSQKRG